jgi:hypothetical protein
VRDAVRIRLGLALIAGGLAASTIALARPPRRGKVVRVERPRLAARESLRACMFNTSPAGEKLICFGMVPPEIGDTFNVMDDTGYRGRVRVTKVDMGEYDTCQIGVSQDVKFEYEDRAGAPPTSQPSPWSNGLALRGVDLDASMAKVVADHSTLKSPSGKDETIWMAIDLSGDGFPDMISTWYDGCDNPSLRPTPPAAKSVKPLCLDYWLKEDGAWQRKTTDSYYLCM